MIGILPSMFLQEYDYILDYILSEKKTFNKKIKLMGGNLNIFENF